MRVRLGDSRAKSRCRLLCRSRKPRHVAIRAGDILLARTAPGLSARNVMEGRITRLSSGGAVVSRASIAASHLLFISRPAPCGAGAIRRAPRLAGIENSLLPFGGLNKKF